MTPNSRWFIVCAANKVTLGFEVGHGSVAQRAAAFTLEMLHVLPEIPECFLILPLLLLLLQRLHLKVPEANITNPRTLQSFSLWGIPKHPHTPESSRDDSSHPLLQHSPASSPHLRSFAKVLSVDKNPLVWVETGCVPWGASTLQVCLFSHLLQFAAG